MAETPFTDEWLKVFQEGQRHTKPAAETLKELANIRKSISELKDKLDKLDDMFDGLEKQILTKSPKWDKTAENVERGVWIVMSAVILGLLALIGLK